MKRKTTAILILILASSTLLPGLASAAAASEPQACTWSVGAAAYPVTPLDSHLRQRVYLGGYGVGPFRGSASGVRDEIWARALALSCRGETVVLLALDLVGLSCNDIHEIRSRVKQGTGIPEANVLVTSTHTHSAPDMTGLFGGVPRDYRDHLRCRAVNAALDAFRTMRPAELSFATADCRDAVENRRGAPHLDPALHVLHARSAEGESIATLVVFGVHATWFDTDNRLVSADLPGPLIAAIERDLGGVAMFAAGIQGDQAPRKRGLSMEQYGEELAAAAMSAIEHDPARIPPSLVLRRSRFKLSIRNSVFILAGLLGLLPEYRFCFSACHGFYVNAEVNHLRLGDRLGLATAPGEVCARVGLDIKETGGIDRTAVLGLVNGTYGYFVHEADWKRGIPFITKGYEESASMGRHAASTIRVQLRALIRAD